MKRLKTITATVCITLMPLSGWAQCRLPIRDAISFGGGGLTSLSQGENDYMDLNNNPLCYHIEIDYKHFDSTGSGAFGLDYQYFGNSKHYNKLNCHYIAPTFTLRGVMGQNNNNSFFATVGAGYFHYSERTNQYNKFDKGYFAANLTLAYEVAFAKGAGLQFKLGFIFADWGFNPDYRPKYQRNDPYETQNLFESKMNYLSFGMAFTFGE